MGSIPTAPAINIKVDIMNREVVKFLAERIENGLLERMAIQEIQDFEIKIEDNKIDCSIFLKSEIRKIPISISVMK